jgi:phosphoserine phosphatase RsbU/P
MRTMKVSVARACLFGVVLFGAGAPYAVAATSTGVPLLTAEGLGKGTVALDGLWQFHLGDNPDWASRSLNDATGQEGWEQLTADKPWGEQGHHSYTGYAWYRRHLHLEPAAGASPEFSLLVPHVEDVYEVYWNGVLVGKEGKFPPGSAYPFNPVPQIYPLGQARDGVLAVRVWKAPLGSFDTGLQGGLLAPPLAGSEAALTDRKTDFNYRWLRSRQYVFALDALTFLVMALSLVAWLRNRSQKLLLWMSLYALSVELGLFLTGLHIPWSYRFGLGWLQPVHALADISLWFLLLYLLRLTENRFLVRLTVWLAWIDLTANVLDGALTMFDWSSPAAVHWEQGADAFLTIFETVPELLPLLLVGFAIRKKLDPARWLVAIFAFSSSLISNFLIAVSQGSRYTHWTLGRTINAPVFTILGNPFTLTTLANTGLLLSIVYAVYRYTREAALRQGAIEQELRSAQELQQVLIPELLPSLPGYSVTSAYIPAQEVGGDFFQVIPAGPDGAAWLVLGDVSGKGLRAAMTVSLIVGMLRTLAEFTTQPAEILAGLNRRLYGRLHGGFVTCLVMLLHADGSCVLASAGHPPPFVNQKEVALPGALPLGLVAETVYEQRTVPLHEGDHLVLYTDGLLEARAASGELFSFDRLSSLMQQKPSAEEATKAATDFGQEDDITVLTLTRLAKGEVASTLLKAPVLVPV